MGNALNKPAKLANHIKNRADDMSNYTIKAKDLEDRRINLQQGAILLIHRII